MGEHFVLKNDPKTEFQLLDDGFILIDGQRERNNGFYAYDDMESVELHKLWYNGLATWLRYTTWLINGAPLVDEIPKKGSLVIGIGKTKLTVYLTNADMLLKAKKLVALLNKKTKHVFNR
jgi:hypothetical protein